MKVKELESFPPNENPFLHDAYHMGVRIGNNVMVMMENHDDQECKYMIVVDKTTGKRLQIDFEV